MTNTTMYNNQMMSCSASASCANAVSSCANSANIVVILDAMIMASIIICAILAICNLISLSILSILSITLLAILVIGKKLKIPRVRRQ